MSAETKRQSTSPVKDSAEGVTTSSPERVQVHNGGGGNTTGKETTNDKTPTKTNGHAPPPMAKNNNNNNSNASKSMNVLRERSFIRPTNPQMMHHHPINSAIFMLDPMHQKRRSFGHQVVNYPMGHHLQSSVSASAIHHHHHHHHQPQQQQQQQHQQQNLRDVRMDGMALGAAGQQQHGGRNKLNAHAQEFTMALPHHYPQESLLQLSKSGGNLNLHYAMQNQRISMQFGQRAAPTTTTTTTKGEKRSVPGAHLPSSQMPLVTSPSMGNVLQPSTHRVKFAPEPQILSHSPSPYATSNHNKPHKQKGHAAQPATALGGGIPLQRSKSLSSADTIARGLAGLGFALSADVKDIGPFSPEHQQLIDIAVQDPNQLNARDLMELATVALRRAVEARRYALPMSQLCITIVAKERKETFLEALLNTCRQWYQEREKILGPAINSRNPSRPRFTAFMAFLTEMFCQLKRRQLQLRTECDGVSPPMVLLTVLLKCCEDCVRPSVRSLSEIECLFYVLTCIGRDLETHLAEQLDGLLASVRDAFLNSNASAPAIRRTLLQLIELQASRWQLPGNTVLYYYPSK